MLGTLKTRRPTEYGFRKKEEWIARDVKFIEKHEASRKACPANLLDVDENRSTNMEVEFSINSNISQDLEYLYNGDDL